MVLSGRFGPFLDAVIADGILTSCRDGVSAHGWSPASVAYIYHICEGASRVHARFYAGSKLLHFLCGLPLGTIALTVGGAL